MSVSCHISAGTIACYEKLTLVSGVACPVSEPDPLDNHKTFIESLSQAPYNNQDQLREKWNVISHHIVTSLPITISAVINRHNIDFV